MLKIKEKMELMKAKEKFSSIIKKFESVELLRKERNGGNKEAAVDRRKIDRLKKKIQSIEGRKDILKDREESKYKKL